MWQKHLKIEGGGGKKKKLKTKKKKSGSCGSWPHGQCIQPQDKKRGEQIIGTQLWMGL